MFLLTLLFHRYSNNLLQGFSNNTTYISYEKSRHWLQATAKVVVFQQWEQAMIVLKGHHFRQTWICNCKSASELIPILDSQVEFDNQTQAQIQLTKNELFDRSIKHKINNIVNINWSNEWNSCLPFYQWLWEPIYRCNADTSYNTSSLSQIQSQKKERKKVSTCHVIYQSKVFI